MKKYYAKDDDGAIFVIRFNGTSSTPVPSGGLLVDESAVEVTAEHPKWNGQVWPVNVVKSATFEQKASIAIETAKRNLGW